MKVKLLMVDRTDDKELQPLIERYANRVVHYVPFEMVIVPKPKNATKLPMQKLKEMEGDTILKLVATSDHLVVLDERGKEFTSTDFSKMMERHMNSGLKNLVFIIGGAFGFSESVYKRANSKMALSKMTFTHQMIRVIFIEQLYRACTIMRGEGYHH